MSDDVEIDTGWDGFAERATVFFRLATFEEDEREYKLRAVAPLAEAKKALSSDGEWQSLVKKGFNNKDNNIVSYFTTMRFMEWVNTEPEVAGSALADLWRDPLGDVMTTGDAFDRALPREVVGGQGIRCNLFAYLLGAVDPIVFPNYKVTAMRLSFELTRFPGIPPNATLGEQYVHGLDWFDCFVLEGNQRGIALRDRLDAQGLMWCITQGDTRPKGLTVEEWEDLRLYRTIPTQMREQKKVATKRTVKPARRPNTAICPQCGIDEDVMAIGPVGDRWSFVCEAGPGHLEPYEFTVSSL